MNSDAHLGLALEVFSIPYQFQSCWLSDFCFFFLLWVQAACRSIETTDPDLKRFVLNQPSRQITLMSSGPEETIYWMEVGPSTNTCVSAITLSLSLSLSLATPQHGG